MLLLFYIFTFYIQAKGVVKIWKEVTDTADKQLGILLSGSWYFLGKFITDPLLKKKAWDIVCTARLSCTLY